MTPITVMPEYFTAFNVLLLQLELNKKTPFLGHLQF